MEGFLNISNQQTLLRIGDLSEIAAARRAGMTLARHLGFDEAAVDRVARVLTEAATNIVRHAVHGEIIIRAVSAGTRVGIEVLALDRGPGMASLGASMKDGASTAGTHDGGLGAISRLSDEFDGYTAAGGGAVLWMLLWAMPEEHARPAWEIGVVCRPIASEEECGDAWAVDDRPDGLSVIVADGIGHGPHAASAARAAMGVISQSPCRSPVAMINEAHSALRGSRGAAVAAACISRRDGRLHFSGVGNIEACIAEGDASRCLMSHNGIVGSNLRKVQEFELPWNAASTLIMHSDGINTRWKLSSYPGLYARHPAVIAAVLYRDFVRERDDALVLVLREAGA